MRRAPDQAVMERLSAYLDGELAPAERAAFERDLSVNAELRAALERQRAVSRHLVVDEVDRRAARRIRADLRDRRARGPARGAAPRRGLERLERSWPRPSWFRPWLPLAATVAAAAVVLALTLPLGARPTQAVHGGAVAEQYTLALDGLAGGQP